MTLHQITSAAINPALALLPGKMDSREARVLLLAIGLQESRFEHRFQVVQGRPGAKGPARGYWQFEQGTRASKGGVWGVYLHPASTDLLRTLCAARSVPCDPQAIWRAIETDDVLAAGVARLLIYTDPLQLPALGDVAGAWQLYAHRCWRPGRPHPETWPAYYAQALEAINASGALHRCKKL